MKLSKQRFMVFAASSDGGKSWQNIRWGWYPYGFGKRPIVRRVRK